MLTHSHRFSAADFCRMAEAGILREDQRVELLDGEICDMMPIGEFHASVVDDLAELFSEQRRQRFRLRIQNPLQLDDHSIVQPDVVLLKRNEPRSRAVSPQAGDALLVVEVADSSLGYDQHEKLPRYARVGIPEVWIVNVPERRMEVYRNPNYLNYAESGLLTPGETATPAAFPDIRVPVADLFS